MTYSPGMIFRIARPNGRFHDVRYSFSRIVRTQNRWPSRIVLEMTIFCSGE